MQQASGHCRLKYGKLRSAIRASFVIMWKQTNAPVSVPRAANALPVRTATALPPLLPPGDLDPFRVDSKYSASLRNMALDMQQRGV